MADLKYDVAGIGNALVDVIANADDKFLTANGIEKGGMTLIDAARADELYGKMAASIEMSGGSCANTIAGLASLGGKGAFFGKVRGDQLGEVFIHDVTYMEGYLWDEPGAKEAFLKAAKIAHDAGRLVSLTLSDSFCVDRFRDEFRRLARDEVDLLFANEAEILSLYETDVFDDALQQVRKDCKFAALTRSEQGSVIVADGEVHVVDAEPVSKVVDTTGAGDLFAAGFLYGLTRGKDPVTCGRLGALAAAEVISHYGPRPQVSLADLAKQKGLA